MDTPTLLIIGKDTISADGSLRAHALGFLASKTAIRRFLRSFEFSRIARYADCPVMQNILSKYGSAAVPCTMLATILLFGAGCRTTQPTGPSVFPLPVTETSAPTSTQAAKLPDGLEIRSATFGDGRTVHFALLAIEQGKAAWNLHNRPAEPKSASAWRENLKTNLVINGAYFSEDYRPSGYYHLPGATGTRISWPSATVQREDSGYTGMILIRDGKMSLSYLPKASKPEPSVQDAVLLSFPTLVASGTAIVHEDSGKLGRRTVLAQDSQGSIYVIATQDGSLTLYELSKWLASQPEKFITAVNLDGGKSTGISYGMDGSEYDIPSVPVPNVISATYRP